ncbi:MAG: phosphoglycerate dehydrogenase [Gammaproteobacteria bacterium]|nr:phosphoglycerate dehydrogenase [Gammaproteobacteria bacterium]MDH4255861.1 phosphoglycerate dehydrogenase [Gammaproteobacteria bacterium]MDH5312122.1 phosphoglycerate dehydrogenase [Gammaproteobacteria bacterium]
MYKILTLNNIAVAGLQRFPRDRYEVASEIAHPDAILLRSYNMHGMAIPESVAAVGRAGAGVNNIPIDAMSKRGVPVFNAPGANANAVKELVVAGLLIAARNICDAHDYVRGLKLGGEELEKAVEAGKKQFVGFELPGRTLGVIGLGSIGVQVANAALSLGMNVVGFDPKITVQSAWKLSSGVEKVETLDHLFKKSDAVSVHVPLTDDTRNLVNKDRLALMKKGGVLVNFSRGAVVDNAAVIAALDSGRLHRYVCDFPKSELIAHKKTVVLPHLGASTLEAEENCAVMVAENVRDYLEHGNIRFSVNFPESVMPRADTYRLTIANANVPNMVGQISTSLAKAGLNIEDLLNKSMGELAYTVVDLDGPVPEATIAELRSIKGVLALRNLGKPLS